MRYKLHAIVTAIISVVLMAGCIDSGSDVDTEAGRRFGPSWMALQHDPIVRGAGQFQEDMDLRAQFPHAGVVHDGYLFGSDTTVGANYGLYFFDGLTSRQGAKVALVSASPVAYMGTYLWSDETRIFAPMVPATIITLTKNADTGTFTRSTNLCTQETSGATGYFIRWDGNDAKFLRRSGTFAAESGAGDHTVTQAVTGATMDPDGYATLASQGVLVQASTPTDNATKFFAVLDIKDKNISRQFVDCGVIDGSQLLLMFSSKNIPSASYTKDIWYNRPDTSSEWLLLMSVAYGGTGDAAIGLHHWHGATMVRDVNGVTDSHKLYIYTGDGNGSSSVLVCNDLVDLLANPETWRTRFGWDLAADADRTTFLTTGAGAPYCVLTGSQDARTYDIVADADARYAYWIMDSSNTDVYAHKLDMTTDVATKMPGIIGGVGGFGKCLSNRGIVFACGSSRPDDLVWTDTNDGWMRFYALDERASSFQEIWAGERMDLADPTNSLIWWLNLVEFPVGSSKDRAATIWAGKIPSTIAPRGDTIVGQYAPRSFGMHTMSSTTNTARISKPPMLNLIVNSRFADFAGSAFVNIAATLATLTQETTIVDTVENHKYAMKVTPSGTGASKATYTLPAQVLETVRGNWITVRVRVRKNTTQVVYVRWVDGKQLRFATPPTFTSSTDYQTTYIQAFVPTDATSGTIELIARWSGAGVDPVYFSDLQLVLGARHNLMPPKIPSLYDF